MNIPHAEYATVKRQVADAQAGSREFDVPAEFKTVTRQVLDLDALKAKGYTVTAEGRVTAGPSGEAIVPAPRGTGSKKMTDAKSKTASKDFATLDNAAIDYVREIAIPAEFKTVTRKVLDQPATTREIEIPAVYKTVARRVLDQAASSREIAIPAEFKTVSTRVVDQPATTREIDVPAEFRTITRQVLVTPASTRTIDIPATYRTASR